MLAVFDNTAARIEMLLVSIPESLGLLVFGVLLIAAAVLLRRMMPKPAGIDDREPGEIGELR
jgi:hypothetical protein